MIQQQTQLLIFMRFPKLGAVKTRLAAAVGDREALRVHTLLAHRTLGIAYDFRRLHPDVSIVLVVEPPGSVDDLVRIFPGPWTVEGQLGNHLGERMGYALQRAFERGGRKVVLIGSDIVDLQASDLAVAFERIKDDTGVLGPARDGGFYLVGLGRFTGEPFHPEEWGTETIFERTADLFHGAGLRLEALSVRRDVDRKEDLQRMLLDPLFRERLSIVMPTLKDPALLRSRLQTLQSRMWPDDELIIVQGCDHGRVSVHESDSHTRLMTAPRGRGLQLDHGARLARGTILLFLHDDTELPDLFPYLVRKASQASEMALGCFRLSFEPPSRAVDLIARWANLRSHLLRLPYGDQSLFCRRETFELVGGFRRRYLMEDVELVRACRALGSLVIIDEPVSTSADRYLRRGILRNSLHNHATMLLYHLGMDEARLARWYYRQ